MRREGLRQCRLLTALLQSLDSATSNFFRLLAISFHQENLCESVIRVCRKAMICQLNTQTAGTVYVLMSFRKSSNASEKESYVIFDTSLKTMVACLLEMKTSSRKFNESRVHIFFPLFR